MKKIIKKILFWTNLFFALLLLGAYGANIVNPEFIWQFAFCGLLYPVLFLINFIFLFFWIWRKNWSWLLPFLVLALGWSNAGKYLQPQLFKKANDEAAQINIMSYNVRLFNYYEWDKRVSVRDSILGFFQDADPDIICMQEFLTVTNRKKNNEAQIDTSLNKYPYKHIFYTYKTSVFSNYGIATYSKYPILRKSSIRFKDSYNSCISTDILFEKDTIRIFNVHLESIKFKKKNYDSMDSLAMHFNSSRLGEVLDISGHLKLAYIKRARQVDELKWYIQQSPYPVILCGDFNDTPVSYTYNGVRGDLEDSFIEAGRGIGNTYRGKFPSFRIDYIFHSPRFEAINYQTHKVNLSDHYPISCGLRKL